MAFIRVTTLLLVIFILVESRAKLLERAKSDLNGSTEAKITRTDFKSKHLSDGAAILFADELKVLLERYLFGMCPQSFKITLGRSKNATTTTLACDLDTEQRELAGRLATVALRAHASSRAECSRLGQVLANTLGELARTAANRQGFNTPAANTEANKKRKLSKSQKAKLQAKQRTALAVKKKAAAAAAAAAAKMTSS